MPDGSWLMEAAGKVIMLPDLPQSAIRNPQWRRRLLLCVVMLTAGGAGCVTRTLSITSEPTGARVMLNGQPVGKTPVKLGFRHHGTYRVELRKDGYRPVTAALRLKRKFYEYAGPDFFVEVLWPGEIHDRRAAHYKLEKIPPFDKAALLARARAAAAEAERVIPRLFAAPPPGTDSKDRSVLPRPKRKKPPKKKPPGKKPPDPNLPEPPDVPEIEAGRKK